jgi:hypothetical protein
MLLPLLDVKGFCDRMEQQGYNCKPQLGATQGNISCTECPFGFFGNNECPKRKKGEADFYRKQSKRLYEKYNWRNKLDELL